MKEPEKGFDSASLNARASYTLAVASRIENADGLHEGGMPAFAEELVKDGTVSPEAGFLALKAAQTEKVMRRRWPFTRFLVAVRDLFTGRWGWGG